MADAPDDLAAVLDDLERGLKLIDDRTPDYETARDMYEGKAREVATSPALQSLINATAQRHPLSFAHIPVDAVLDKVNLVGITADGAAKDRLDELFDELDFDDEADDWHIKAGYFGDYYVIVDPREEDEATGAAVSLAVSGSSPLSTVVVYSSKDERTPLFGVKRWTDGTGAAKRWRAAVFYDDATVLLVTGPGQGEAAPKAELFMPDLDEDNTPGSERIAHQGGRMLVVHYAVGGKPYGIPLHRKAFGAQDALTKISATNLASVEGQGFAARWALADPAAEIDDDIDADFGTDSGDTLPADEDGRTTATSGSRVRSLPGTIAMLRGVKAVGQFDAASPEAALKNAEWYLRSMAVITGTPLFEFDLSGEQPSGESRRRAESRLNKRAAKVARALGNANKTLADTMLAVLGIDPESANVTVKWAPIETSTDAEGLELVGLKVKAGVPVRAALIEAGYDPETVDEWFPGEGPAFSPELVASIAESLTKLGTARTLGAITDEQAAKLLPLVLTGGERRVDLSDAEPDDAIEADAAETVERDPRLVAAEAATAEAAALKARAEALGTLVRAGAEQVAAAELAGLPGLTFPNVPVTVRIPEGDAAELEGGAPAAPAAPTPPPAAPAEDEPVDELEPDEVT